MRIPNPVQFYDDTPVFAGEDWVQYHLANYGTETCPTCHHSEGLLIIHFKAPVNGYRIFAVHKEHLHKLQEG